MDGLNDLFRAGALHEVSDGASLQHLEDDPAVLVSGERDDARIRRASADLPRGTRAAPRRHLHVEQRDVRSEPLGEIDRFLRVAPRSDEIEGAVALDQLAHRVAERGLVLSNEDSDPSALRSPGR